MLKPTNKKTEDGKDIVAGLYQFIETYGLPLEVLISEIDRRGYMPDWVDYIESAVKAGSKRERAVLKLKTAVKDVYSPEFYKGWEASLDRYNNNRHTTEE